MLWCLCQDEVWSRALFSVARYLQCEQCFTSVKHWSIYLFWLNVMWMPPSMKKRKWLLFRMIFNQYLSSDNTSTFFWFSASLLFISFQIWLSDTSLSPLPCLLISLFGNSPMAHQAKWFIVWCLSMLCRILAGLIPVGMTKQTSKYKALSNYNCTGYVMGWPLTPENQTQASGNGTVQLWYTCVWSLQKCWKIKITFKLICSSYRKPQNHTLKIS